MRWLDGITDSMDMSFGRLQALVTDRGAWHAAVHRVTKSQTWLRNWTKLSWTEAVSIQNMTVFHRENTAQLLVRSRVEEGRKGMLGGEISSCLTIKSSSRVSGPHSGRIATDSSRWVSSEGMLHRWASQRTMGTGEEPRERGSMPRPGESGRGQWSEQQKPHPQLQGSWSPSEDGRQHTGYPKTSSGGLLNWVLISSSFCADSVPSHHWATWWVLNLLIDRIRRVYILSYSLSAATENSSSPIRFQCMYVCVSESQNMPMKTELQGRTDHPSVLVKLPDTWLRSRPHAPCCLGDAGVDLGESEDTHGSKWAGAQSCEGLESMWRMGTLWHKQGNGGRVAGAPDGPVEDISLSAPRWALPVLSTASVCKWETCTSAAPFELLDFEPHVSWTTRAG